MIIWEVFFALAVTKVELLYRISAQELMESSLRIYMKTQSSEKRLLEEVDGAKIFPVYGEAVLLICSSPRIATWSRAEGSDIPTVQPESTLISSLFPQQRQSERENLALETDSDNGPPIDQEVHIPNNKLAASLRDKVVIRGYLYGFDNKQETKVRWLFNGAPLIIIRDSNLEESSRFDFEHSLIIKSVRNSYYGTYTLEAQSGSRVSKDTVKVQRSTRVEIEGAGGIVTVKESEPYFYACAILLSYKPGDSATVEIKTLDEGSAIPSRDYEAINQRVYLDYNSPRHCAVLEILQNKVVTGREPRSFKVGLSRLSAPTSVDISETSLTVHIVDDDTIQVDFVETRITIKKNVKFSPCIFLIEGSIDEGLMIDLYPSFAEGVVPNKIHSKDEHFQLNSTHNTSCINLKSVQDKYVDPDQHFAMSIVQPDYLEVHLVRPSMEILIERTNGVRIRIKKPFRRTIIEGDLGEMPSLEICFTLVTVRKGLRREAVVHVRTNGVTADSLTDFISLNSYYIFTPGAMMGAHHCAEVFIRGDGLIEKDESFHVIFSTTAPDFIPPKRSAVEVTIKEDNDKGNCRNLTHLENGHIVVNGTTYYSRAYYHCDEGFSNFPAGAFYRGCGGHGWVGIVPECVKTCKQQFISNGEVRYSGNDGYVLPVTSIAMVSCFPLYRLVGDRVKFCEHKGWSGVHTYCEQITCPELLHPTRGTVKYYKVFPRSIAVYQCIFGYKTLGENSRMCGDDGQWKGYEPTCEKEAGHFIHHNMLMEYTVIILATCILQFNSFV